MTTQTTTSVAIAMWVPASALTANPVAEQRAPTMPARGPHPRIRATAFALNILVIHALGDAISPFIIGTIADEYDLRTGFFVVSGAMLVGGALWLWASRYLAADTEAAPHSLGGPAAAGFPVVVAKGE